MPYGSRITFRVFAAVWKTSHFHPWTIFICMTQSGPLLQSHEHTAPDISLKCTEKYVNIVQNFTKKWMTNNIFLIFATCKDLMIEYSSIAFRLVNLESIMNGMWISRSSGSRLFAFNKQILCAIKNEMFFFVSSIESAILGVLCRFNWKHINHWYFYLNHESNIT